MKRIIFSLLLLLSLSGCELWNTREINNHYLVNETDKKIVHILYCSSSFLSQDSLEYYVNERCDTTLEWTVSAITGIVTEHGYLTYEGFRIYNITDTTSIYWKNFWGGYEYQGDAIPEIFNHSKGIESRDITNNEFIWTINYYLTVNDTLLSLMKKDSSMLERFKEYYKK